MLLVSSAIRLAIHRRPQIYHSAPSLHVCVCVCLHTRASVRKRRRMSVQESFILVNEDNEGSVFVRGRVCVCSPSSLCVFQSVIMMST